MEIAVADVTEERDRNADLGDVGGRFGNALSQPGDGHADIRREATTARLQLQTGKVGIVARLPQPAAILGAGRPFKIGAPEFIGYRLDNLRLLLDASR